MAGPLPYRQEWQKDWLASTNVRTLSLAAKGLLTEIKAYQWEDGDVPSDPAAVAKMAGGDTKEFRAAWKEIRPLLEEIEGGRLVYRPLADQRESVIAKVQKLTQNGTKGAEAKKAKAKAIADPNAPPNAEANGQQSASNVPAKPIANNQKPVMPSGIAAAPDLVPLLGGWQPLGDWLDDPDLRRGLSRIEGNRSPGVAPVKAEQVGVLAEVLRTNHVGLRDLVGVLEDPETKGWRKLEPEGVLRVWRRRLTEGAGNLKSRGNPEGEDDSEQARKSRVAAQIAAIEREAEERGLGGAR